MSREKTQPRNDVVANLLALQMTEGKNTIESVWLLKRAGMDHADIAQLLGISEDSVRANVSKQKKKLGRGAA